MRVVAALLLVVAACKGGDDSSKAKSSAKTAPPTAAADPWSEKPKADIKDPKLARLVELAQNGPGKDKYPQADAVVALEEDVITYKPDGSVVTKHHSIVKLIDAQRGKEKFADVHIAFDSERETLVIDTARTVNADAVPHVASNDEIGDIVPAYLADATIYSGVRERVISFPAVDEGSVIELEYTRTTRSTPDSPRGGVAMLARWNPVLERIVTITAPTKITPQFVVDGGDKLQPKLTTGTDSRTWTWRLENLPDRHPEYGSLTEEAVLPRLVYGFVNAWPDVLEPVAGRFLAKAVPSPLPTEVVDQATALVAGATTETEKAQKLFAFVAHDIRSVQLPLGAAGYEPHGPEIVLKNRYADERDKVGLLLALAASQGIKGRPVLVRTGKVPVIPSVPTLAQFDRMVAKLDIGGKEIWLDPNDEHGQFNVVFAGQDNLVLPFDKGGTELGSRPALDPETSVSTARVSYTLSANGDLDAKYTYELTGYYADLASQQMRALKGELLDRFFQQSAAGVSASALDKKHTVGDTLAVTGALAVTHQISIPGYSAAQAGMRVFELPALSIGVASDQPSASLSTRKTPLWVGVPRTERREITVQIPAGWKVSYVPPQIDGSADGVRYTQGCEVSGQLVTCKGEIKLDKLVVPVDQYAAFRDAITKLQAYERRIVLLTKA